MDATRYAPARRLALAPLAMLLLAAGPVQTPSYTLAVAANDRPSALDPGSPGFDRAGNAYLRFGTSLRIVAADGTARTLDLAAPATAAIDRDVLHGGAWDGKWDTSFLQDTAVVFDESDRAYTLVVPRYSNLGHAVLLWSDDLCRTWHAVALAGRDATLEKPDSFNDHAGPPTVISYESYGAYVGPRLWLEPMGFANGALVADGPPLLVSDHSLMVSNHSGGGNSTFTTRDKIFVAYDSTGPAQPGTAQFIRQYDRATRSFEGGEISLGRSTTPKGPDNHDLPALTAGRDGKLIAVIGAHHAMFQMLTARRADSAADGWSAPVPVGQPLQGKLYGSYSYVSLNMSRAGTINILARAEGIGYRFQLVQLQKKKGRDWTVWDNGTRQRTIADPDRAFYGAWRQRVTADAAGRLYLNFRYYPNQLSDDEAQTLGMAKDAATQCRAGRCFYDNAPDLAPITLVSDDDGDAWHHP